MAGTSGIVLETSLRLAYATDATAEPGEVLGLVRTNVQVAAWAGTHTQQSKHGALETLPPPPPPLPLALGDLDLGDPAAASR